MIFVRMSFFLAFFLQSPEGYDTITVDTEKVYCYCLCGTKREPVGTETY